MMDLPQKINSSVLGTVLQLTAAEKPTFAARIVDRAGDVEEQFVVDQAWPALVDFYWRLCTRALDSNNDAPNHRIYVGTPRETTHASFAMRTDAAAVWRQGAARESSMLLRTSTALSILADACLMVASGGRLSDENFKKILKNIVTTLPDHELELLQVFGQWNHFATTVQEALTQQHNILYAPA